MTMALGCWDAFTKGYGTLRQKMKRLATADINRQKINESTEIKTYLNGSKL